MRRRGAADVHEEGGDGWVLVLLELGVEEGEFGPFGVAGAEEEDCWFHFDSFDSFIFVYVGRLVVLGVGGMVRV